MAYYEDMSPHEYSTNEPNTYNIGWIEAKFGFPQGDVPEGFVEELQRLCRTKAEHFYKGSHTCDVCPESATKIPIPGRPLSYGWRTVPETQGNGEIRLYDAEGRILVAPVLIQHYVEVHGYKPPDNFIEAVMCGDEEQKARKKKHKPPFDSQAAIERRMGVRKEPPPPPREKREEVLRDLLSRGISDFMEYVDEMIGKKLSKGDF